MTKRLIPFLVALFILGAPTVAFAAPFGLPESIIPVECRDCAAAWGCVLQTFDNLVAFALAFAVIIATLLFAYAGFIWIFSPASPQNIEKGKKILWNTVIGLIITLGAWLIVNTLLRVLTDYTVDSATSVLVGGVSNWCITSEEGETRTPLVPPTPTDNAFSYQGGISLQKNTASGPLQQLLSCMSKRVPGNVGEISSLSDDAIITGTATWASCRAGNSVCAHAANSCHYGGTRCGDQSFAVDFGDERNKTVLKEAALACGASKVIDEGNHLHVSIGAAHSCGCD